MADQRIRIDDTGDILLVVLPRRGDRYRLVAGILFFLIGVSYLLWWYGRPTHGPVQRIDSLVLGFLWIIMSLIHFGVYNSRRALVFSKTKFRLRDRFFGLKLTTTYPMEEIQNVRFLPRKSSDKLELVYDRRDR